MINPFERFYDTEIEVYEVGENTYEKKGEKTLLGSVVCDIQPYENELENRIYGLTENKKYKVFCDKTDLIKIGRYAKFGDEFFEIIKAECWNFGMTAMMRSEKMQIDINYDNGLSDIANNIENNFADIIGQGAQTVCESAKSLCPVDTGRLQSSINVQPAEIRRLYRLIRNMRYLLNSVRRKWRHSRILCRHFYQTRKQYCLQSQRR